MGWFKNLKEKSGLRLRTLKTGQRLPIAVVALIIAMDIYLISVLFQGIGWTSQKIQTPVEKITPALLEVARKPQKLWPETLQLGEPDRSASNWGLPQDKRPNEGAYIEYNQKKLSSGRADSFSYNCEYNYHRYDYSQDWVGFGNSDIAKEADAVIPTSWQDTGWVGQLKRLNDRITAVNSDIRGLVSNYDTMLRERSAQLPASQSLMPTSADQILTQIRDRRGALQSLITQRNTLISQNTPAATVEAWFVSHRQKIEDANAWNERWYSLIVNLAQLAFILPVLIFAVFWHRANMRKSNAEVGMLVSSHLIYVSAVPVIFKILEFVNYILPYKLLADLFNLLWKAGLQYLWSYILIAIGIGIIFVLGRWILSHSKKTKAKFYIQCLEQGLCPKTGRRLPPGCRYSPYTGDPIKKISEGGTPESYRYAPFDNQTGKPNPEWEDLIK